MDLVPEKKWLDDTKNAFGDHLMNFSKDRRCCMLNGRGKEDKNNFTYVSNIGRLVVDYMIVPYNLLSQYENFEVKLISDIISEYNLPFASHSNPPDHSFLQCSVQLSGYFKPMKKDYDKEDEALKHSENSHGFLKRKYNVKSIPSNIFTSERCAVTLNGIIDS